MKNKRLTYKDAGVDIDAGNRLVERIKPLVARTTRKEVLTGIGGFGGLFALTPGKYKNPVLVSGTDGVGTKLKLAQQLQRHETIGVDLVAMCVNDIVVSGAEPLFFLDYFACGRLDPDIAAAVIGGIADGCEQAGAALIGGETAEMPGMYANGDYDLAGFCVGAVERGDLIDGHSIAENDSIIGIASSGPHSNGYSLIRRVLQMAEDSDIDREIEGIPLGMALLTPTRIYAATILGLMQKVVIKGLAHITGGGITDNLPRIFSTALHARINTASWKQGPVFDWLQNTANIADEEMRRTFNCGVGMVAIVSPEHEAAALETLRACGEKAWRLGEVVAGGGGVEYV